MEGAIILIILVVGIVFLAFLSGRSDPSGQKPETRSTRPRTSAAQKRPVFQEKSTISHAPRTLRGAAYVIDGDSLVIKKTQVRIFGVDAPEMNHPFGKKAKWAMFALCKGQEIRAEVIAEDAHGRTVAKCFLPDGRDLSAELVKQGLALDWPKFSKGIYSGLEPADARRKLWLADARQKGRMHVWRNFEEKQKRS